MARQGCRALGTRSLRPSLAVSCTHFRLEPHVIPRQTRSWGEVPRRDELVSCGEGTRQEAQHGSSVARPDTSDPDAERFGAGPGRASGKVRDWSMASPGTAGGAPWCDVGPDRFSSHLDQPIDLASVTDVRQEERMRKTRGWIGAQTGGGRRRFRHRGRAAGRGQPHRSLPARTFPRPLLSARTIPRPGPSTRPACPART